MGDADEILSPPCPWRPPAQARVWNVTQLREEAARERQRGDMFENLYFDESARASDLGAQLEELRARYESEVIRRWELEDECDRLAAALPFNAKPKRRRKREK